METALFFYNILIIIAFALCCVDFYFLYHKHMDKSQLYISIVFFLFILDNLRLYMFEFLPEFKINYFFNVASYEYVTNILAFIIIISYRITIISLERTLLKIKEAFLWGVIFIITIITSAFSKDITFSILANMVLGLTAISVFSYALYRYKSVGGFPKRTFVPNIRPSFLIASIFFEAFIMIEGILVTMGIWILNEHRLLSIELLSIFYSFVAIRFLNKRHILAEKFEEISIDNFDKELLLKFSKAHGLTHRENEILGYLIQGISNNEICKATYISEGTVKTHSHNIYLKLQVKNRTQLGIKFREFQKIK